MNYKSFPNKSLGVFTSINNQLVFWFNNHLTITQNLVDHNRSSTIRDTGVKENNKGVLLELRWNSCQSVLPPSKHPETNGYFWVNDPSTPIAECPNWIIEQMLIVPKVTASTPPELPLLSYPEKNNNYRDEPIPLLNCLSKDHRSLIESGAGEGGRNDGGAKVARDLIGTESRLQYLGFDFTGRARDLFDDYCDRCSPAIDSHERETIWDSATKSHPTPCLSDDKLENCYKAWQGHQNNQGQSQNTSSNRQPYQTSGNSTLKPEQQSNVIPFQRQEQIKLPIKETLKSLMERNLSSADLENEFLELSGIYSRYSKNAIEVLYRKLSEEIEKQSDKNNQKNNLDKLIRLSKNSLDLSDYLHPNLATPLKNIAQWMGTSQEAILTTLLPVSASLIHLGTNLELIGATNFYANPIIYSGIVAESGSLKSPNQKLLTNPLANLQEIADKNYESLIQDYQEELELYKKSLKDKNNPPLPIPTPPKRREYFVVDVTSEAVAGVQADQPERGFVGFQDELKALISSQNAYRGGKGSDAEKLLSGRDGSGIKVNRAGGKRLFCKRSGYSITGGIQPDVLRNLMGSFDDPNGFWARFIWCILPVAPSRYPENAVAFDVDNLLLDIYKKIENQSPSTHRLTPDARELYKDWYNQLDDLKLKEIRQGLRAVYSKMKGVTGEFALILHRLNAAVGNYQPDEFISKDEMTKAIKLSKFYISQIKLIHAEGEAEQGEIAPQLKKLYDFALTQNSWLTASDIKKGCRLFKKSTPEDIRQSCLDLVEMGYGSVEGEGKSLKYCADLQKLTKVDTLSTSTIKPQSFDKTGLQEINPNLEVDKVDKKLTFCQPPKTLDINGLQPLDAAKVDKLTHKTNEFNQWDEKTEVDTVLLEPRQLCQLSPSNPDIIAVDTPSTSVNFLSTLSTFSERSPEPTTTTNPTLNDLISAEPLPSLSNLATLIPFESLLEGETIFDRSHHSYTLKQLVGEEWECTNGRLISRSNIPMFHRAPKTAWA